VSNREVTAQAPSSSTAIGQRTPPARTPSASRSDITGPQQALLDALAFLESVGIAPASRVQVALVAGVSPTSSGFEKNAGKVRSLGLVHYPREAAMELTDEGRASAKAPASVSVADLHQTLYGLLSGPQADLLRALVHAYPGILTREELAAIAGVSVTSSGFEKNVGMLRTRGLAIYPEKGYVEAAPAIFLEAGVE
jgi:hypothetical protein